MSTTAATAEGNTYEVAESGPSRKKISIVIPADTVTRKLTDSIDGVTSAAALPGFRKGRVPRWLVEKRFGPSVRKEAKQELVVSAVTDAVKELKLNIVGDAYGGNVEQVELESGKPFAFEVEIEVLPEFEVPNLDGIEIKKPMLEVTDQTVADELKKLCVNEGSLETREVAEAGDYLTGHAIMKGKDGTEFYNLDGAVVQKPTPDKKGQGMILGIVVSDFDTQLGSPRPGQSVTLTAKGPEQHEIEGIRNNDLTITFEVSRIDRIVPAPVEQIVQASGLESEDKLHEIMRKRLEGNVQVQQATALRGQVAKYLLDNSKMELPQRLSAQQAARTLERQRLELMYRGVEAHKIEERIAELRTASAAAATRDLKLFFILQRAAEALSVTVNEGEVNQRIVQIAMQRNVRPDQLRQELIRNRQVSGLAQQIRDHKTLDAIIAKAKVTEVSAEEYNKTAKAG